MKSPDVVFVACLFLVSALGLVLAYIDPAVGALGGLTVVVGSDGVLWQVQTTFLSVGFAGLAIAAQLFAEAPTAVGASRSSVLDHVRAGWFVGVGLTANLIIAVQTAWLPSPIGALGVSLFWFLPTVALLVNSSIRLVALFGNPSRLDEVVRTSLVDTLARRLELTAKSQGESQRRLKSLAKLGLRLGDLTERTAVLNVPVPRAGLVFKGVKPQVLSHALALLAPAVATGGAGPMGTAYSPAQVSIELLPGERTRFGQTAFRVGSDRPLPDELRNRLIRTLQASVDFESADVVTPEEETDREIANLKDAIGVSLRTGAFGTAERALKLLSDVVRSVWISRSDTAESSKRPNTRQRDWLFRSIWEVEQDATLSSRSADLFINQAMTRAIEAPKVNSIAYVEECLRSFEHLWSEILVDERSSSERHLNRICTCIQNLAEYSFPFADLRSELQSRAVWSFVAIVKLSVEAGRPDSAVRAAQELVGLFEYGDHKESGRADVRAGQLVLSGWLRYRRSRDDQHGTTYFALETILVPNGSKKEILRAREVAEAATSHSRWDWWELDDGGSRRVRTMQLGRYVDQVELEALAKARGSLPEAANQTISSTYERLLRLAEETGTDESETGPNATLKEALAARVQEWQHAERERLGREPISRGRVERIAASIRETFKAGTRLAEVIPTVQRQSSKAESARPILGMNLRVPRDYVVDRVFNNTYADPSDLGRMIARGFQDAEDAKIVDVLRSVSPFPSAANEAAIIRAIKDLGSAARNFAFLTPYGGLDDLDEWYSRDLAEALESVERIETGALEHEAILFDRNSSLKSVRRPEAKNGLETVGGTTISLGVFDDVVSDGEPQVRLESGEYFVVWPGPKPRVVRFVSDLWAPE
ncbi:MAG: hypothetical protein KIT89_12785 [Microcella sp.]|uniref:hypothetical protein n=1 Tax=Microcella sp. TaxID=1913979 RepID=UPI0024C581F2|nr:hypothetical protein [Microcella sp.]UYN83536.1 MAG: hypothetical protein KIT89_12785 [Microcella sp.]